MQPATLSPSAPATYPTYEYCPLDFPSQQIRLAKIRRDGQGLIRCDIKAFEYLNCPAYNALSYTWGPPPPPTFAIVMDGSSRLEIRENLYYFLIEYCKDVESQDSKVRGGLRHTRSDPHQTFEEYIWIDQICIDQSSISERNFQVGLMSMIYEGSVSVIVWLGGRNNDTMFDDTLRPRGTLDPVWDDTDTDNFRKAVYALDHGRSLQPALRTILSHVYFSRVWIVQEVLLAQHVIAMVPGYKARHAFWQKLCLAYLMSPQRRSEGPLTGSLFRRRPPSPEDPRPRSEVRLEEYLITFMRSECSNLRDKVYGLMGLVDESQRLTVEYGKSCTEVFVDTLRVMVRTAPTWAIENIRLGITLFEWLKLGQVMGVRAHHLHGFAQLLLEAPLIMGSISFYSDVLRPTYKSHVAIDIGLEAAAQTVDANNRPCTATEGLADRWWYDSRHRVDLSISRYYIDCPTPDLVKEYDVEKDFEDACQRAERLLLKEESTS
ncbi:HET-domain-containing protein [Setomelanomma holmii]|uniref:HET-domain-containing protein n=1 Tax=Setomelanomma holmii TaxID=210430 RepID=A0A9P4LLG0_9PLEO|nr:HET-domain-containing protein [Setomelanomma holmii]